MGEPIAVEHAARSVRVCAVDELAPGAVTKVNTLPAIAVFNVDGEFFATSDLCSHDNSSLSDEGYIENGEVECGWHMAKFCIKSGVVTAPPAKTPLRKFDVRVEGREIYVQVPDGILIRG